MPSTIDAALQSWHTLNHALRDCSEKFAEQLIEAELKGRRRAQHLRRINARLSKLRRSRERLQLERTILRKSGSR